MGEFTSRSFPQILPNEANALWMLVLPFFVLKNSLHGSASCRPTVSRLTKLIRARCLSSKYKLAPQYPFPAALLDIMLVYLSVLDPAPGSYHDPIEASSIVLAGDSADVILCFSLIQVILDMKKKQSWILQYVLHNRNIDVKIPAGLTMFSMAGEMIEASPSWIKTGKSISFATSHPQLNHDSQKTAFNPLIRPAGTHTVTIRRFAIHLLLK